MKMVKLAILVMGVPFLIGYLDLVFYPIYKDVAYYELKPHTYPSESKIKECQDTVDTAYNDYADGNGLHRVNKYTQVQMENVPGGELKQALFNLTYAVEYNNCSNPIDYKIVGLELHKEKMSVNEIIKML